MLKNIWRRFKTPREDISIFGLTRFSVLQARGVKIRELPIDEQRARLFDEARMEARFRLFDAFVVPSLLANFRDYPRFVYGVAISKELPQKWKERLSSSLSQINHELIYVPTGKDAYPHFKLFVRNRAETQTVFTFRIDDDDALSKNYLDLILRRQPEESSGLSLDEGLFIRKRLNGRIHLEPRKIPNIALGLGLYGPPDRTIYDLGGHMQIHKKVPVINVPGVNWIRSVHSVNDSKLKLDHAGHIAPDEAVRQIGKSSAFQHMNAQTLIDALA